jgi:hypothetical protein
MELNITKKDKFKITNDKKDKTNKKVASGK